MSRAAEPHRLLLIALRTYPRQLVLAVVFGVLALGSALALAGISAWLITRAWQMPPILDLSIAVVAVRALGISRAVWRYCERLAGHNTALRGAAAVREWIYGRLATDAAAASALRRGALLDNMGPDIDAVADAVVRSIIPMAVAAVLAVAATAVIAVISPTAALVLAVSLLVAGVLAPAMAAAAVRERESRTAQARSDHAETVLTILQHAPELRVGGRLLAMLADARKARAAWSRAQDTAAAPAAIASAAPTLATGAAVLGALYAAIGLAGSVAPTTVAILVLLPLSAFEATAALPAAAIGLSRARVATARIERLIGDDGAHTMPAEVPPRGAPRPSDLSFTDLCWRTGESTGGPLTGEVLAGQRLAVVGASGIGKTSLLMTLAGLVAPDSGDIRVNGHALTDLPRAATIRFFAEDAHLFATTVRDNLLLARGDATDDELMAALAAVGLGAWIGGLPEGLATVLTGGAAAISGGQRRRLLLARAVLSPVPILLLDEPTEHLDGRDADRLLRDLLDPGSALFAGRTLIVATHHLPDSVDSPRLRLGDTVHA